MKKILITLLFLPIILLLTKFNVNAQTQVDFHTNYGDFRIQLYDSLVPVTSSNFINLVSTEFYDGSLFHRVIDNFMIQGGDVLPTPSIIVDEFNSSLSNIQKTISMANSGPNTGTCQFFINLTNNTYLDFDKAPFSSKHPVFGITISGFNVVQDIGNVQTNSNDMPIDDVIMDSVRIVDALLSNNNIFLETVTNNKLIRIIDMFGKEITNKKKSPLFYIYEDGTVEKRIVIE
jgi:cyclophilin family peptidyl-prolyl cis-trans isomerase|tara:strand:- start:137 stop:832 length:696 start_codon:yes stop_codon:yes gene_type:complete